MNTEGIQPILRAAEYVCMSTEMQQFSIAYQQAAIRLYAAQRGLAIVRTYADEARSGLTLRQRPALIQLLSDVEGGRADFDVIVVYDVSRWGRFQDTDEGAHYEFRCRKAGKQVEYCAEQFANDTGPITAVMKAIKRAMAAEYSRELAVKTGSAQARATMQGYLHGGMPGYGLRRMLIDQNGGQKGLLQRGACKAIRSDRVTLVPGPPDEIAIVRRVFDLYVNKHMFKHRIAELLNHEGIPYVDRRTWSYQHIRHMLANERYIGTIVFDRTTSCLRLGKPGDGRVRNDPAKWVRGTAGYAPIVSPELFAKAKRLESQARIWYRTDDALLDPLRALWQKHGYLSNDLIEATADMPTAQTYRKRFGNLRTAYARIGYVFKHNHMGTKRHFSSMKAVRKIVPKLIEQANSAGLAAKWDWYGRRVKFNNGLTAGIGVARYLATRRHRSHRWVVHSKHKEKPNVLLVARMDILHQHPIDYYLLPSDILGNENTYFDQRGLLEIYKCRNLKDAVSKSVAWAQLAPSDGSGRGLMF